MTGSERDLAVALMGLAIRPATHLLGESMPLLLAYLGGYSRAQARLGEVAILDNNLLQEFGDWLGREKALEGSDWYWKVFILDSSERSAVTMLALFREFLLARGTPVSDDDAQDFYFGRGRWAPTKPKAAAP